MSLNHLNDLDREIRGINENDSLHIQHHKDQIYSAKQLNAINNIDYRTYKETSTNSPNEKSEDATLNLIKLLIQLIAIVAAIVIPILLIVAGPKELLGLIF